MTDDPFEASMFDALTALEDIARTRQDVWLFEFSQFLSLCVRTTDPDLRKDLTDTVTRTLTRLVAER
jgi:hypothetical protein